MAKNNVNVSAQALGGVLAKCVIRINEQYNNSNASYEAKAAAGVATALFGKMVIEEFAAVQGQDKDTYSEKSMMAALVIMEKDLDEKEGTNA